MHNKVTNVRFTEKCTQLFHGFYKNFLINVLIFLNHMLRGGRRARKDRFKGSTFNVRGCFLTSEPRTQNPEPLKIKGLGNS